MKIPKPGFRSRKCGFTLLELLVACAISVVLLGILASMASQSGRLANTTHSRLAISHEAETALDYLARDIAGLAIPRREGSTLAVFPESVPGPTGASASSWWIMMLSRPAAQTARGSLAAVSYRLLYLDPLIPGGTNRSFGLYRSVLSAQETANNLSALSDLYQGYWKDQWNGYAAQDGGRTILGDYLAGNIVGIKLTFQNRKLTGALDSRLTPTKQMNWTYLGLAMDGDASSDAARDRQIESIEIALTMLSSEGASLLNAGAITLGDAIQRYGITATRVIPLPAEGL